MELIDRVFTSAHQNIYVKIVFTNTATSKEAYEDTFARLSPELLTLYPLKGADNTFVDNTGNFVTVLGDSLIIGVVPPIPTWAEFIEGVRRVLKLVVQVLGSLQSHAVLLGYVSILRVADTSIIQISKIFNLAVQSPVQLNDKCERFSAAMLVNYEGGKVDIALHNTIQGDDILLVFEVLYIKEEEVLIDTKALSELQKDLVVYHNHIEQIYDYCLTAEIKDHFRAELTIKELESAGN